MYIIDLPGGTVVKNLPASETQGMWVWSLGGEDPLEEEMVTHSSILARKTPRTEEPGRATVHGITKSWTRLNMHTCMHSRYIISLHPFKDVLLSTFHRWGNWQSEQSGNCPEPHSRTKARVQVYLNLRTAFFIITLLFSLKNIEHHCLQDSWTDTL